ncbi:MAG: uncharacterized protein A8A55_0457 [Amphiamblys sp. WSBS2006]|nr:MAG: uncharacterized protein A8A55_0457 [Amphiamblys sp. WSBS2006]
MKTLFLLLLAVSFVLSGKYFLTEDYVFTVEDGERRCRKENGRIAKVPKGERSDAAKAIKDGSEFAARIREFDGDTNEGKGFVMLVGGKVLPWSAERISLKALCVKNCGKPLFSTGLFCCLLFVFCVLC